MNGRLTIFWITMMPVSIAAAWVNRRRLRVGAVAVGAGVGGLVGLAGRSRGGEPDGGEQRRDAQDIAADVVERIVEQTDVSPAPEGSAA